MSDNNKKKKEPWRGRGGKTFFGGRSFQFEKKKLDPGDFPKDSHGSPTNITNIFYDRIPYKGWRYYFPEEVYESESEIVVQTRAAQRFFLRTKPIIVLKDLEEKRYYNLDLKIISEDEEFLTDWCTFRDDLRESPERALNSLSLAFYEYVSDYIRTEQDPELPSVRIRIHNFGPILPIKDIKAALFGKLVGIRGTVIRVSGRKLVCTSMGFGCNSCMATTSIQLKDGVYRLPKSCPADNCRSKTFTPLCSSDLTQTKSYQTMKIQENIADEMSEGGRVPRTIQVDLSDDLVESCGPGDNVSVTGIVKMKTNEENKKGKSPNLFALYVEAVMIVNSKTGVNSASRQAHCSVEFSIKDYYAIQEIHSEESPFRLLVNSLCPTLYGHEMVKAGLLLALVGGSASSRRADPHVLIVGDPGLGKSHLLHACAQVSPRGVYVCGNTTSSSGLTVTLVKESGGDFALEAGALVLANHGCCCIDEFDKMSSQHQALLEAMEQQRISVAKGGVVCSLPAHASIIAAANPAGGHYNPLRTVAENLKMGSALLSRFDLVFILLDRPDEELDSMLSDHVMTLHAGLKGKKGRFSSSSVLSTSVHLPEDKGQPLSERLKLKPGEQVDLVPQSLLRKYIAYVRKYITNPRLSAEAAHVLQDFYLELRQLKESTPITTRQLESLIRLTQARAKLELREEASREDAQEIVALMRWSMRDVVTGHLDPIRANNGAGLSQGSKVKRFIGALQSKAKLENRDTFSVKELQEVISLMNLQVQDFYQFISVLNVQGFIIKRAANLYQLLSL